MQSFDPRRRPKAKPARRSLRKPLIGLAVLLVLFTGAAFAQSTKKDEKPGTNAPVNNSQSLQLPAKKGVLRTFTPEQFRDLYNNFAYPNTARIDEASPITGNAEADERIRAVAISRGYQLRSAPVTNTFQDVGEGYLLQQRSAQPWLDMKAAAKSDGINLGLTAAYRSADAQRDIFIGRLNALGISYNSLATGGYDAQISQILSMTAIPGYSRHHTGYTIDISCENQPASTFENTTCFEWLKAENYKNAKRFGWIPSYPEGTSKQGPEPESWEYVWVGTETLTE